MASSRSRQMLHRIALVAFVALLGVGIWLRDVEAIAFSIAVLIGILLLPIRNGLLGRIVLALVLADAAVWMVPAAVSNLSHRDAVVCVAVPVGLAALAIAGVLAAVGMGSRLVPLVMVGLAAGVTVVSAVTTQEGVAARPGELRIAGRGVSFSPARLRADDGRVSIRFRNTDLFWHTFTIDALDVDLRVPVKGTRRLTFEAPPGIYEYYCAIPGHDAAGMNGTLVVS